jgi:hypothetical protein
MLSRQVATTMGRAMKRAKMQSMTVDNLREFWVAQIEVFDEMTIFSKPSAEKASFLNLSEPGSS